MNLKKRLLLFFILAQVLDGALTFYGISKGVFAKEVNFAPAWLIANLGLVPGLLILKSISIVLGVLIIISPKLKKGFLWAFVAVTALTWAVVIGQIAPLIYFFLLRNYL